MVRKHSNDYERGRHEVENRIIRRIDSGVPLDIVIPVDPRSNWPNFVEQLKWHQADIAWLMLGTEYPQQG